VIHAALKAKELGVTVLGFSGKSGRELKQACDFSLPFLWPKEIYGIDWSQTRLHEELRAWKEDQLGWHMNGKLVTET